jgi:hypothetical protein
MHIFLILEENFALEAKGNIKDKGKRKMYTSLWPLSTWIDSPEV